MSARLGGRPRTILARWLLGSGEPSQSETAPRPMTEIQPFEDPRMFERNRVDNTAVLTTVTAASVTLADGRELKGRFIHSEARSFADCLNGSGAFMEFETYHGERTFLAKTQFVSIKPLIVPEARKLPTRGGDDFNPHAILGIDRDASWDDIRRAFIERSKKYHPDRYANVELPAEVREYLAAVARRINAAYSELESLELASRKAATPKVKPIFTSGPTSAASFTR